ALDAYKTGKSLDILKMTEMGAYGLVASNGFTEAVTGRDMFGNKVSEEKRKQGALEAALSLVGAGALAKHVNKGIPLAKSPQASKVEKGKKILDQVKEFKVPTNVKIRVHKTVTPDGATFPIIHADVKTTAVKDLGIVKMAGSGKGIKGIVKPVSNMNEFFDMEFGKKISNSLSKSKVKYDGQSIYKVEKKTDNQYLKKGYGVYLDALHKDHLEVIDKTGNVKYVLNLDGTLNPDKTKKALGRVVKGWK
ncbi:T7SS effector LXG polymorphic toxin, partial [Bacillus velezensis]